jgi:hypothetical protein
MDNTGPSRPDIKQTDEENVRLHYCVTDTYHFLDKLLPVEPDIVDKILQKMTDDRLYDSQSERWARLPDPGPEFEDESLYGPFLDIVEAIRLAAENLRTGTAKVGPTMWADYHSQQTQVARLRPDVLFALKSLADYVQSEESKVRTLLSVVRLARVFHRRSKRRVRTPSS